MPRRVLIVDDSRVGRRMVKCSLPPDWEVEIVEAADGNAAIDALSNDIFDVVFLDLTMPFVDGYDVLRWLKYSNDPPFVIVVSGDLQPEAKARVMLLGAFDFVAKPPDADEVRRLLDLAGVLR